MDNVNKIKVDVHDAPPVQEVHTTTTTTDIPDQMRTQVTMWYDFLQATWLRSMAPFMKPHVMKTMMQLADELSSNK